MANKKINQLVLKTTIQSTDLFPLGDPTTGQLFKKTVAELQAAIGGAVISVNGLVGTVVLDTDDIQELPSPTNRYFTEARARAAISLTTTGNSGASTYSNSTGVLNVPTYTLAGLGGITASFFSGGTGITYNSSTGVIDYSGTVYTDASIRALISLTTSGSSGASTYNSSTGVLNVPTYTLAGLGGITLASLSGSAPITYNSSTGAIGITQASGSTNGFLSSTDWNTFNNKQNALTNPVTGTGTTNTIAKFTGTSAIGNSNIIDTGSLITLGSNTNISSGGLGIGTTALTTQSLAVQRQITGGTTANGIIQYGTVQSDVTANAYGIRNDLYTQATTFTLTNYFHYSALGNPLGAGSSVTNQYGFNASSSLTGATNNFGFYGNIAAGTGRWNLYMNGTANNYMAGSLGIGTTSLTGVTLYIAKQITGAVSSYGVIQQGSVSSDVTTAASGFYNIAQIPSGTALPSYTHYSTEASAFVGTVTTQTGFRAASTLTGATNNYGFRGSIPAGTNRWNIFMDGTAQNYLAGNLGIGITIPASALHIDRGTATASYLQFTAGTTTGQTVTDGFDIGIDASGNGIINQQENLPLMIYTNNTERMRITSAGNVGIGTGSPSAKLEVQQSTDNYGYGYSLKNIAGNNWQWVHGGDNNLYVGYNASTRFFVGSSGQVGIGTTTFNAAQTKMQIYDGRVDINMDQGSFRNFSLAGTFIGGVGTGAWAGGSGTDYMIYSINNLEFWSGNTKRGLVTTGGNFLLGTTTDNGERLYVSGSIRATGSITANSDVRLKKNIERIENALEKVGQISGYTYNTIYDEDRHAGVIAQEIDKVLPEIVNKGNDGLMGVEYGNISALLIEAIKDLKQRNEKLEAIVEGLSK